MTVTSTVFVCEVCGKIGASRQTIGDESCYSHAVECWRSSVEMGPKGRVVTAVTADTDWVEPQPEDSQADPRTSGKEKR